MDKDESDLTRFENWEIDPANGRYLCSPEHPMPADAPKESLWSHTSLREIGPQEEHGLGCSTTRYECPDCGVKCRSELPQ